MNVTTIIGARPQFIKAFPVSRAFMEHGIQERTIHTGQHYDEKMSDIFFNELGLKRPDVNLAVGSGAHGHQTGLMLSGVERDLVLNRPDVVVVYGDTNSTLAGALAASKLHIPVAHIEAGLRSFNRKMPEEINRVVTDHLSTFLLAPTQIAVQNLFSEGINKNSIHNVGDVMYDASLLLSNLPRAKSFLESLGLSKKKYILATIHRAENTDSVDILKKILSAFATVAETIPVLLPLHPRTRNICINEGLLKRKPDQLHIVEPIGFFDMIETEQNAIAIATDSGGVQKEAFFYKVPCITLRTETEWVETVELQWNILAPPTEVSDLASLILSRIKTKGLDGNPYGDGNASTKIAQIIR